MFGSCKSISGKENVFMCLVAFQKIFWKIFLVFGKEEGRVKTQKNTDKTQKNTARSRDRRRAKHRSRDRDRCGASGSTVRLVLHD